MERNDFRLDNILKNHIGEEIFSLAYGIVKTSRILKDSSDHNIEIIVRISDHNFFERNYLYNGKIFRSGHIDLYPSEEYYHKYPFDAEKAWFQ